MDTTPPLPPSLRRVREAAAPGHPALVHDEWRRAFPWLIQGTTTRGASAHPFDLGLFAKGSPRDAVLENWRALRGVTGATYVVHAHQVHGADVHVHTAASVAALRSARSAAHDAVDPVPLLAPDADGHATREPGLLLGVTTADCVPVFVVDPVRRGVAALHAGWRGVAAGVLERGLSALERDLGSRRSDLVVHLGPAICGRCYEVGPEVFAALGEPAPDGATPIDVRAVLVRRALAAGVGLAHVTVSEHCTRCTGRALFSHRAGDGQRQVGYIGVRTARLPAADTGGVDAGGHAGVTAPRRGDA